MISDALKAKIRTEIPGEGCWKNDDSFEDFCTVARTLARAGIGEEVIIEVLDIAYQAAISEFES